MACAAVLAPLPPSEPAPSPASTRNAWSYRGGQPRRGDARTRRGCASGAASAEPCDASPAAQVTLVALVSLWANALPRVRRADAAAPLCAAGADSRERRRIREEKIDGGLAQDSG